MLKSIEGWVAIVVSDCFFDGAGIVRFVQIIAGGWFMLGADSHLINVLQRGASLWLVAVVYDVVKML